MTSSKFGPQHRIQQPPAICKLPPIPEPPDTPINILQAALLWTGYDRYVIPFDCRGDCLLTRNDTPWSEFFTGQTQTQPNWLKLTIQRLLNSNLWTVHLTAWTNTDFRDEVIDLIQQPPHGQPDLGKVAFDPGDRNATCITALITL